MPCFFVTHRPEAFQHPQDFVSPVVNALPDTRTRESQSHRHDHTTLLPLRSAVALTATNRPNRLPVRLENGAIGVLSHLSLGPLVPLRLLDLAYAKHATAEVFVLCRQPFCTRRTGGVHTIFQI